MSRHAGRTQDRHVAYLFTPGGVIRLAEGRTRREIDVTVASVILCRYALEENVTELWP